MPQSFMKEREAKIFAHIQKTHQANVAASAASSSSSSNATIAPGGTSFLAWAAAKHGVLIEPGDLWMYN